MNKIASFLGCSLILAGGYNDSAHAETPLRCNQKQSYCVTENKRLTIGDKVVVLNRKNKIIAYGEVAGMQGHNRRVNITKKVSKIHRFARVRADRTGNLGPLKEQYSEFRHSKKRAFGIMAGMSSVTVSGSTLGFGLEGFYQQKWLGGGSWTARGHYINVSGTAGAAEVGGEEDFTINALLAYGGYAFDFFRENKLSLRTEVNLGIAQVGVSTSGASAPPEVDKIGNGIGYAGRAGVDVGYNHFESWRPAATLSFELINQARSTNLGIGVIANL